MPYEAKATRSYGQPPAAVSQAAAEVMAAIGGKATKSSRPGEGQVEATFNKEVAGRAFGNRCQLLARVTGAAGESTVAVECWPIDPLGKKLLFGVLGEPAKLVVDAFLARLDARLAPRPA
jgi:hypothetical protein